ncbi:outer membrane beta-barrel protein [Bdellovibrio sp. HCB-162]|uniref:outer membrane beta-barrel protein n=1 Tax=Bdellovibrio sp. HCB-162 TaxID=3394234 RepID=UPI0039BCCD58
MKHFAIVFVIVALFISTQAKAVGFYIEPGITYEKGDNKLEWPAPLGDSTGNTRGLGVDLKLGMHVESSFFIALEGAYSKPHFEQSATNYDADAKSTLYGAVIGAQMPVVGLRIWAGYIFGGELDPDESGGVDVKFKDARGPKVGLGFKILMLSLNVEYMDLEYNDSVLEKPGSVAGSLDNKLKNKLGLVSVSIPLTL